MLRWLKERKKGKKENGKEEYGFKGKNADYGFEEKVYHIYEEIPDLPESTESPGPYMVVPLDLGDKKIKEKKVSFQCARDASGDSGICQTLDLVDSVKESPNGKVNRNVPVMGIGQKNSKRGGEFAFALVGRKISSTSNLPSPKPKGKAVKGPALPARNYIKKSLSAKSVENMSESKLRSRQLLENILSDLSKSSDDICNTDRDETIEAKLSGSSSNSMDELSDKRKNNLSMDSNDTGCEYDMSTSGESDKSSQDSYEYYLHQVEQNFILRCRVQEQLSKGKDTIPSPLRSDIQMGDDSDSDSLTTISTISQVTVHHCKTRHSPASSSDEGTMADLSESENSSGYYDSCAVLPKDSKPVIKLTSAILQNSSSSSNRSRSSRRKTHVSKDRRVVSTQPKAKTTILEEICEKYESLSESGSSELYSRRSNSEVYCPPQTPPVVNQSFRKVSGSSSRISDPAQIYQAGGSTRNNRLLSDLIMMNYSRQGQQF